LLLLVIFFSSFSYWTCNSDYRANNNQKGFNLNSLIPLTYYFKRWLPAVRLVREASTEVSSKLRIQLWLHNHCSQCVQRTNS
jgi:hypothetical protein